MLPEYHILSQLFLRTPLLSYTDYQAAISEELTSNPHFRLALYLASPGFYAVLESKNFAISALNPKELTSLQKYFNRMSFRPTPFGLFSSFSVAKWGNEGNIILPGADHTQLHLLPDQQVATLAEKILSPGLFEIIYQVNPTLYRLAGEYRFIKTTVHTDRTPFSFSLESFEVNPLTSRLCLFLRCSNKTGKDIIHFLVTKTGCDEQEATAYLEFLAEAQVVRPVCGMNITGSDYLLHHEEQHSPGFRDIAQVIKKFRWLSSSAPACITALRDLEEDLKRVFKSRGKAQPDKYFYANAERHVVAGSLPVKYQETLIAASHALARLTEVIKPPMLESFIKDFKERFDGMKIPLMQALDPDAGVGYGHFADKASAAPLLKQLQMPDQTRSSPMVDWSAARRLLMTKWTESGTRENVIRLEENDLAELDAPGKVYPPSLAIIFRLTHEGMLIENAGGVAAASLIGRFTPFSEEVCQLAASITRMESEVNPEVIFAEIGQLSDTHTDNINRRRSIYDYEIPLNSVSLLAMDKQIRLDELLVSVKNDTIILESLRLKKVVIPRLSSAYNFRHNNLAVFRFLCDLQYQGFHAGLTMDLESYFPGMSHYPRVTFDNVILSPAKWHIRSQPVSPDGIEMFREKLRLPACVALTRSDQQIVFNLDDESDRRFFCDCVSGLPAFTLQEFFLPDKEAQTVMTTAGKPVISQFIAFLVNPNTVYRNVPFLAPLTAKMQREFVLGSQWLYLKIYCTTASANDILVRKILPLIGEFRKQGPACWFFIRYADPGPHIRLRIKIKPERTGEVIALFRKQFSDLVKDHIIREYQADTYRRELERYGPDRIDAAEQVFHASSELVAHFIKNNNQGFCSTDEFAISCFELILATAEASVTRQIDFLASVSQSFYQEFKGDKKFKVGLDVLYRGKKQEFADAICDDGIYARLKIEKQQCNFSRALAAVMTGNSFDAAKKNALLADIIHMHLNRLYSDNQRQQEMVLYYCFHKYKLSRQALSIRSARCSLALDQ
ncbi:MAG: lantibiotic dehydratase [Sphingobacteriales bacterium]